MKKIFSILLVCSLLTACDPSDNGGSSPTVPNPKPEAPATGFTAQEKALAYNLSTAYAQWKEDTGCAWATENPQAYELAQAYALGSYASRQGIQRVDLLSIVLEKFKTLQDPSASSKEMLLLARRLIEKENSK